MELAINATVDTLVIYLAGTALLTAMDLAERTIGPVPLEEIVATTAVQARWPKWALLAVLDKII